MHVCQNSGGRAPEHAPQASRSHAHIFFLVNDPALHKYTHVCSALHKYTHICLRATHTPPACMLGEPRSASQCFQNRARAPALMSQHRIQRFLPNPCRRLCGAGHTRHRARADNKHERYPVGASTDSGERRTRGKRPRPHSSYRKAGACAAQDEPLRSGAYQRESLQVQKRRRTSSTLHNSLHAAAHGACAAGDRRAAAPVRRALAGAGTRPCAPRARPPCGTPASRSARCCSQSTAASASPLPTRRTDCRTCARTPRRRVRASTYARAGGAAGGSGRAPRPPAAHWAQRGHGQAQVVQAGQRRGLRRETRRDLGLEARDGGYHGGQPAL